MRTGSLTPSRSEAQLRSLRKRFIVFLMAFILPVSGIIFLYQRYTEASAHDRIISEVIGNTQQSKLAFEQVVQLATSHIKRISIQLSDALDKPELRLQENDWTALEKLGMRRFGSGELTGLNLDTWWRERYGSLFVNSAPSNPNLIRKEINATMTIFPSIRAAHLAHPYFQWTAYYSTDADFLMVYPYVSPHDLEKSTGTDSTDSMLKNMFEAQTKQIVQDIGAQKNPQRKPYWTSPYFDSGGKGAMATLFAPQYLGNEFVGVIGTDITLHMFDGVLSDARRKLGHLIVVDRKGYVLADDDTKKRRDMNIVNIEQSLPQSLFALVKHRSTIPQNLMQHADNWNWSYTAVGESDWELIVYFSDGELQALTKQDTGSAVWAMLGLLAILCLAAWTISYYFALPSLRLVEFLIRLSRNAEQSVPQVTKSWQPTFDLIAETSQQRLAYLRQIETQSANLEATVKLRTSEVVAQSLLAEKARNDIALISELGRQITSSLDLPAIENTVYRHVHQLLPFDRFSIALFDARHSTVRFRFVTENGTKQTPYQLDVVSCEQSVQQCLLEKKEIVLACDTVSTNQNSEQRNDDSSPYRSLMMMPMIVHEKILGMICIQDTQADRYRQNDVVILRSLAAYSSIAFDNALTYQRLKQTQEKLIEQEKLAALGSIVAGVAHELNTPIGNSLLAASTLADMTEQTSREITNGKLRRSYFNDYTDNAIQACRLLVRNLTKAAQLITSFKQIAVDQSSDQRRRFNLKQVTGDLIATLDHRLIRENRSIEIHIADTIVLDSYPNAYCQVISNLVQNALIHAFDGHQEGRIQIRAETQSTTSEIIITVEDNGSGIASQHLPHIFEPFYTTRFGQGGSGLGLHICYNIVTAVLGGTITVQSVQGEATMVEIRLPTEAM